MPQESAGAAQRRSFKSHNTNNNDNNDNSYRSRGLEKNVLENELLKNELRDIAAGSYRSRGLGRAVLEKAAGRNRGVYSEEGGEEWEAHELSLEI